MDREELKDEYLEDYDEMDDNEMNDDLDVCVKFLWGQKNK